MPRKKDMFNLISEVNEYQIADASLNESQAFMQELIELFSLTMGVNELLTESVRTLADKYDTWLQQKNISPEDLGFLIAGLSVLISQEGRTTIQKDDLINMGVQGDLKRAEKLDNVDLNRVIRNQIIHVGKIYAKRLASMVVQAIRQRNFAQIRNYILKLAHYVDRIKSKETYTRQNPTDVKNQRRAAPNVNDIPSRG